MAQTSPTPKIFGSSYRPPRPTRSTPKWGKSWKAIIIVVIVFAGILLISRLPVFRLKTVELVGDQENTIASQVDALHGQSIFSHEITNLVNNARTNVAVAAFDCRRGIPNALRCSLTLRQAAMVWQSGDKQYLVDKTGVIFAANTADRADIITINDLQKQPVTLGLVVASTEIINQYQALASALKAKQLTVARLELNESLYQVTVILSRPGKSDLRALFLLSNDVNNQVESVSTVLAEKGDSITQSVDARVPGYVYVK